MFTGYTCRLYYDKVPFNHLTAEFIYLTPSAECAGPRSIGLSQSSSQRVNRHLRCNCQHASAWSAVSKGDVLLAPAGDQFQLACAGVCLAIAGAHRRRRLRLRATVERTPALRYSVDVELAVAAVSAGQIGTGSRRRREHDRRRRRYGV